MMKNYHHFIIAILLGLSFLQAHAQQPQLLPTRLKIAVFAPLYIDSAFSGSEYKLGNNNLPKNMLPGLAFYNGVSMAIDSLEKENINARVLLYDTKGSTENLKDVILKPEMQDVSLIIASFNNNSEIKTLADFALQKKILLISPTFPNDGGVHNNPYFLIINSTLRTHCQNIYRHIQQYYSLGNIVYVRRKGNVEDFIQSSFLSSVKTTPSVALKLKIIELSDNFSNDDLMRHLDSTKRNTVICGSIDDAFDLKVLHTLNPKAASYRLTVIGMPTWEGIKDLDRSDCKNMDIVYSASYNFQRKDKAVKQFINQYQDIYAAKPAGDWALQGFEAMYRFTRLVLQYGELAPQFLSSGKYKVFNDFDIKPVYMAGNNGQRGVSYMENKKLYFIKKNSGIVVSVK
jgi:hypothetical protein